MRSDAGFRHVFLVLGSCMLMFSPAIIFLIPSMIPMTFYFKKYTWVYYTPIESFIVFGVGLGILIVCCAILFFGRLKKWAVRTSIILALLAGILFYGSAMGYIAISDEGFTYRGIFEQKKQFSGWNEVAHAEIEEAARGTSDNATFIFTFKNGDVLTLKETEHLRRTRAKMRAQFKINKIPVDYTEAE
ncbi:hypothetical protein [Solibacillus sp. CAU 1738]|uniref:hypothetical protein n=1 Tax=Solibacillus sp. CAU 1738 TaxID=3140363 RepID=UPI0032607AD0